MRNIKIKKIILIKQKIISGLVAFVFLATSFLPAISPVQAATDATLSFDQSSVSVDVGDTVTLVARVNPGSNEVGAVELDVTFNPSILHLDSITRSAAFNTTLGGPTIDNTGTGNTDGTGSIDVGLLTDPVSYITTTSNVATYVFTAQAAATNSPVAFAVTSDASAHGVYVVQTRTPAAVTVSGEEEPGEELAEETYSVGGTVSGLSGTVVLQNNDGDNLSVSANGSFTFATELADSAAYDVSVLTQPAGQTCVVSSGSGNIDAADVTDVAISCSNVGPVRSAGSPSGELSKGTTNATLSLTTNENATCRFSSIAGNAYASMTNTFSGAGTTTHTYALTGFSNGTDYSYFVRCQKEDLTVNTDDYTISFSVDDSDKKEVKKTKRKLAVSSKRLKRGQTIVESGKRFSKKSEVALYFGKFGGGYYEPKILKTNSEGKFSISYKIPANKPFGTYRWYAVDKKTGRKSKLNYFRVVP